MRQLEKWLHQWKLQMHPKKCNFMIFNDTGKKSTNENLKFKLNNDYIPSCNSIKFLGLTFDVGLNFNDHVKEIKKKVQQQTKCNKNSIK